jgi:hypothetical protein
VWFFRDRCVRWFRLNEEKGTVDVGFDPIKLGESVYNSIGEGVGFG